MIYKILSGILVVCGLMLFIAGVINHWPRHCVIGGIVFLTGLIIIRHEWRRIMKDIKAAMAKLEET